MSLTAREESGSPSRSEPIPVGMHVATCYGVFDIGTQEFNYNNDLKRSRKMVFVFEVPGERIEVEKDGEKLNLPRAISSEYSVSLSKKSNLRPALESWRGRAFTNDELKGFDLLNVLGAPCMLNITHGVTKAGHPFAKISNIVPMMKGMEKPEQENPSVKFSFEESTEYPIIFPEGMPEWIQGKAKDSLEYKQMEEGSRTTQEPKAANVAEGATGDDVTDEDVPF